MKIVKYKRPERREKIEKGEKTETNVPKKGGWLLLEEDDCKSIKSGLSWRHCNWHCLASARKLMRGLKIKREKKGSIRRSLTILKTMVRIGACLSVQAPSHWLPPIYVQKYTSTILKSSHKCTHTRSFANALSVPGRRLVRWMYFFFSLSLNHIFA